LYLGRKLSKAPTVLSRDYNMLKKKIGQI